VLAAEAAADSAWDAATKRAHTSVSEQVRRDDESVKSNKAMIAALAKANLEAEAAKEKAVEKELSSNLPAGAKRSRAAQAEAKDEEAGRRAREAEELSLEMNPEPRAGAAEGAEGAEGSDASDGSDASEGSESEHDSVLRHDLGLEEIAPKPAAAAARAVTQAERQAKAKLANQQAG